MKTIYKYKLFPGYTVVNLPKDAEILMANAQNDDVFIWAKIDTEAPEEQKIFYTAGTGHPFPGKNNKHIGSFMMENGKLVFHTFELLDKS